jgi:hypothetical protein
MMADGRSDGRGCLNKRVMAFQGMSVVDGFIAVV